MTRWFRCSLSVARLFRLSVGASPAGLCFRLHTPLIEPDVRICRIRLSEKTHAIANAISLTSCGSNSNGVRTNAPIVIKYASSAKAVRTELCSTHKIPKGTHPQ